MVGKCDTCKLSGDSDAIRPLERNPYGGDSGSTGINLTAYCALKRQIIDPLKVTDEMPITMDGKLMRTRNPGTIMLVLKNAIGNLKMYGVDAEIDYDLSHPIRVTKCPHYKGSG